MNESSEEDSKEYITIEEGQEEEEGTEYIEPNDNSQEQTTTG
ncbi:hypothetical protein [Candidatus Nitrosotenuis cloacae]|nr:hypothetical protein [Candidatus Nitrosotenuis cloacae]